MKFVLEMDISGETFGERENAGMISGFALSVHLNTVADRVNGHSMESGEKGAIMDNNTEQKIGSWSITN